MAANIMFAQLGRRRNERVFRERRNPLVDMREEDVRKRYRFGKANLTYITDLIREQIAPKTQRTHSLSAELQVLIALSFYATGSFLLTLGDCLGVDKATASRALRKVTLALVGLLPRFVKWPTEHEKTEIKNGFFRMAGFPGVIGCIDGTHVRIQRPSNNEPAFINRKGYPSINVQAVCDNNGKFTNLVARWPGSTHDSHVFRTSNLGNKLETENRTLQDGIILGDSGYGCKPFLMTPYLRPANPAEERFNASHKKTRVTIERAFGWLKRRFHCLHGEIRMHPERVCDIIGACAVLHNIAILLREPLLDEDRNVDDGNIVEVYNGPDDGHSVRNCITRRYFNQ